MDQAGLHAWRSLCITSWWRRFYERQTNLHWKRTSSQCKAVKQLFYGNNATCCVCLRKWDRICRALKMRIICEHGFVCKVIWICLLKATMIFLTYWFSWFYKTMLEFLFVLRVENLSSEYELRLHNNLINWSDWSRPRGRCVEPDCQVKKLKLMVSLYLFAPVFKCHNILFDLSATVRECLHFLQKMLKILLFYTL